MKLTINMVIPDDGMDEFRVINGSICTGLVFPRKEIGRAQKRSELNHPGIYVLWQRDRFPDKIYIGEGDDVEQRLVSHLARKSFWSHAAFFTSDADRLNKAHARYIESDLYKLAAQSQRCILVNEQKPKEKKLPEGDKAYADNFLTDMLRCFRVMGLRFFEPLDWEKGNSSSAGEGSTIMGSSATAEVNERARMAGTKHQSDFEVIEDTQRINEIKKKGIELSMRIGGETKATGIGLFNNNDIIVLAGSQAAENVTSSIKEGQPVIIDIRQELIERRIFVKDGKNYKIVKNILFKSTQRSVRVLLGTKRGPDAWRDKDGRFYSVIKRNLQGKRKV